MKAFNRKRKPKHAMKIGHNTEYIYEVDYFGIIFSTKRTSKTRAFDNSRYYSTYKFDFIKLKTVTIINGDKHVQMEE